MQNRKMIMIPEYKPLYAMARCWGRTQGPLTPTMVPLDVIRDLLLQKGKEALTIYEMELDEKKAVTGNKVQLTLDNYTLPYEDIVLGATRNALKPGDTKTDEIKVPSANAPVKPVIVDEVPVDPPVEEEKLVVETTDDNITETPIDTETYVEADVEESTEEVTTEEPAMKTPEFMSPEEIRDIRDKVAEVTGDPYRGMTKAERKAARRKAAEEAARAEMEARMQAQKEKEEATKKEPVVAPVIDPNNIPEVDQEVPEDDATEE